LRAGRNLNGSSLDRVARCGLHVKEGLFSRELISVSPTPLQASDEGFPPYRDAAIPITGGPAVTSDSALKLNHITPVPGVVLVSDGLKTVTVLAARDAFAATAKALTELPDEVASRVVVTLLEEPPLSSLSRRLAFWRARYANPPPKAAKRKRAQKPKDETTGNRLSTEGRARLIAASKAKRQSPEARERIAARRAAREMAATAN
jgi:hypothetical protein